ncbi:hypothetical protein [Floridanema aerugineum]|uniref:Uncharacterized protein n=1 Tax=Floridaenema aerugineum BLCC-F46 TaxID=3153654 RepID=A0ABV4XD15_9CYAN
MLKPVILEVRREDQRLILRWYKGFRCKGNRQKIGNLIISIIHKYALSKFLPLIYIKEISTKDEFYLFFAIQSERLNYVPKEVDFNLIVPLRNRRLIMEEVPENFSYYDQVRDWIGSELDIYEFTHRIPDQPVYKKGYDNAFDFINLPFINHSSLNIEVFSGRYEQLLYWLSAQACGTWESFKKACDALKLEEPKRILRRLKLLGHIESSQNGSRWSTAPTTLVKVDSQFNSQEFILCGQRSLNLISELKNYAQVDVINQTSGEAPPRTRVSTTNSEQLFELIKQIGCQFAIANVGEVSLQLATILPNLANWKYTLRSLQGIVPSLYEWQHFDCNVNDFVSCIFPKETGMYRMQSKEMTAYNYTIFYDKESDRWLQGDWYGLRFLALQHNEKECIARYSTATKRLAIPVCQRWPEIYERALVLASGLLPKYQDSWLLYENVGLELVAQLSDKLNIKCEEVSTRA